MHDVHCILQEMIGTVGRMDDTAGTFLELADESYTCDNGSMIVVLVLTNSES